MLVSLNTDEISFDKVVGMFRAHEMELGWEKKGKRVALVVSQEHSKDEEEYNDPVCLLVRRFDKVLRRAKQSQKKETSSRRMSETEKRPSEIIKADKKVDFQFYECKWFRHYKIECPTTTRRDIKCFGCKGIGHKQFECINDQKRCRGKSLIGINEEESEEESEEEELDNLVAFIGNTEFVEGDAENKFSDYTTYLKNFYTNT